MWVECGSPTHVRCTHILPTFTAVLPKISHSNCCEEFPIGLCGVEEADLEVFCDSWSAGFSGERLYIASASAQITVDTI